jgi:exonuclease SbcC
MDADIAAAEQVLTTLARARVAAEEALSAARLRKVQADAAVEQALAAARATGADPQLADTVARQTLELRRSAAVTSAAEAQKRIDTATSAQRAIDAAAQAEEEVRQQGAAVAAAAAAVAKAEASEQELIASRRRLELLDCAMAVRTAGERLATADGLVARMAALRLRADSTQQEVRALEARRAALVVPSTGVLASIRRLSADLVAARAALAVGLVVTVVPHRPLAVRLQTDGVPSDSTLGAEPLTVEADARVDLDLADVASITIQGGRRDALERVRQLEGRWAAEAAPHLNAARAADVDALDAAAAEARELESAISSKKNELRSIEEQMTALGDPDQARQRAFDEAEACRLRLDGEPLEPLLTELSTLGREPAPVLRARIDAAARQIQELQRQTASHRTAHSVAKDRLRAAQSTLQAARQSRDAAVTGFPGEVTRVLSDARAALAAALVEQQTVTTDLASLEERLATESARIEAAVATARAASDDADKAVPAAEKRHEKAIGDHASQSGSIEQSRRLREAEDLDAANQALRAATERHASLPVPARSVTEPDVTAARHALDSAKAALAAIDGEVHKAHGALEQVGGAVARERLQEALDAYEAAERVERETEAEYEGWKLLLDTMKAADAAQASNLGQVLAPAVASRFETLTEKRYEGVRLTPQLATEGVVVRGAVRSAERMSVGTREQLSTLYRLSLAEYLGTTVVLDDQLVQSDDHRMDWFRQLLLDKAETFQIVVFTCRPGDYLGAAATASGAPTADVTAGRVRAIDLHQAIQRTAAG